MRSASVGAGVTFVFFAMGVARATRLGGFCFRKGTVVLTIVRWMAAGAVVLTGTIAGATDGDVESRVRAWMPEVVTEGSKVYQYAVTGTGAKGRETTMYLWVPEEVTRVRGIIIGGYTRFQVDPLIRQACADKALGIVANLHEYGDIDWGSPGCGERLDRILDALATVSNHPELREAALLPIGHSAGTLYTAKMLHSMPERCLGAITFKGAHAIATDRDTAPVRGIPTLHVQDFVEEYKDRRQTGSIGRQNVAQIRARDTNVLSGIIEENGAKHAAWCFRITPMLAEFIRATADVRFGENGKPRLVSPAAGALVDKRFAEPRFATAPAESYQGDPREAMWYPSLNLARMLTDYNAVQLGKSAQYIGFLDVNTGDVVSGIDTLSGNVTSKRTILRFVGPDTFEVKATFLEKADNPALPQDPVGHAEGAIRFVPHYSSLELVGPGRFRTVFHPLWNSTRLSAYHMGDATHRFEEVLITAPVPQPGGIAQTIEFPTIGTVSREDFPITLKATATSELPVRFTVEYGPAVVRNGNSLVLAEIPKRARYPMNICVWAYQLGSHVEPKVQRATPVRQTIVVE
jgi:hypothetical protein